MTAVTTEPTRHNDPEGGSEAIRRKASFLTRWSKAKQQAGEWKTRFSFSI